MDSMKELERKNITSTNNIDQKTKPAEDENKLSYEERKEINRTINKLEKTIGQTEDEISKLENEIAELDKKMADPANANDHRIFEKYDQLKAKLEKVLGEWEKSTDKYEALKTQKNW
jgi:ATP-binding cassette subfamily F protein 3